MRATSDILAHKVSQARRSKAAFHWRTAHAHPVGSAAYDVHLRCHGAWIRTAQRAEAGDLSPCTVSADGVLLA